MKKNFEFSKAFLGCAIFSIAVIAAGIAGLFVRGINFSTDYAPGLVQEVRIAPAAVEISYSGDATVTVEMDNAGLSLVISGIGADNETRRFDYATYATLNDLAAGLNGVDGVSAVVKTAGSAKSSDAFANSMSTSRLSSEYAYRLYVADESSAVDVDAVRSALSSVNVGKLLQKGSGSEVSFQITVKATAEESSSQELQSKVSNALEEKFGKDNVAVVKTSFNAPAGSSQKIFSSVMLAILTIFFIWVYATLRFHWDFAFGAIIALLHDCLIMFAFISWFQIEFSTTTLAAVLTIFGYSINATVVILDRVRNNIKVMEAKTFNEILNKSLNETMSRSFITTMTTLFASISLWVFNTGSIESFAIVLTIGLISGCYSSIFISSGFISMIRRNWSPSDPMHVAPHKNGPAAVEA